MLAIRGVYDGHSVKLDENLKITHPMEVIITFLHENEKHNDDDITRRQCALLEKGFDMGGIIYSSRDELYGK